MTSQSGPASRRLPQRQRVDLIDLLWKVHLLFLVDNAQARLTHQTVKGVQVTADAAVHLVRDHALIWHVILDDNEAFGPQSLLAAVQELYQVVVCQVALGGKERVKLGHKRVQKQREPSLY